MAKLVYIILESTWYQHDGYESWDQDIFKGIAETEKEAREKIVDLALYYLPDSYNYAGILHDENESIRVTNGNIKYRFYYKPYDLESKNVIFERDDWE